MYSEPFNILKSRAPSEARKKQYCTFNNTHQYKYLGLNVNPTLNISKQGEMLLKKLYQESTF